jgi:hypothetical protein
MVFAAGACPIDEDGVVVPGIEAQARKAVENLFAALSAAGAAPGDVLKTTVYVASSERSDLVRAWDVIAAAFAPPARRARSSGSRSSATPTSWSRSRRSLPLRHEPSAPVAKNSPGSGPDGRQRRQVSLVHDLR